MAKDDRKARRKRRSGGLIDILNGFLTLLVLGLVAAVGAFFWGAAQFNAPGLTTKDTVFLVEPGSSLGVVAQRLEEQKIIAPNQPIRYIARWVLEKPIRAGEFNIPAGASFADIYELFTEGKPIDHFVMVNPGQSSYEVAALINDPSERLTGDPVVQPPEGSVLPVRHDYQPGANRAELLKAMQDEMTATVERAWTECEPDVCGPDGVLKDHDDLVTLASIVEKETGLESERPIVAGLFINRLKKGMPLQTDPTIIYGIHKGVPQQKLTITRSQKAAETPYNTYQFAGLPPTPIANPGEAALMAVANPAETDYLYMMAKTPGDYNDGHYFAATRAEHDANVAKYRAQEREQAAAEAAAAEAAAKESEAAGASQ